MAIIGGFDVHRNQITFDYLDTDTSEVVTGQIRPATRPVLREWLHRFHGCDDVAFAVEGCTGLAVRGGRDDGGRGSAASG